MDRTSIESLFRIAQQFSDREVKDRKNTSNSNINRTINRIFIWYFLAPFSLAVTIALANKLIFQHELLGNISLVILLISYLGILSQPFIVAFLNRAALFQAISNPFSLILGNARTNAYSDYGLLRYLEAKPISQLKYLKLQLESEKDSSLKRMSLIIGAIEKLGIVPGLLAIIITLSKLDQNQPDWIYALAYATPILYVFGIIMHSLLSRLERITALIELAISNNEAALTNGSTGRS